MYINMLNSKGVPLILGNPSASTNGDDNKLARKGRCELQELRLKGLGFRV